MVVALLVKHGYHSTNMLNGLARRLDGEGGFVPPDYRVGIGPEWVRNGRGPVFVLRKGRIGEE